MTDFAQNKDYSPISEDYNDSLVTPVSDQSQPQSTDDFEQKSVFLNIVKAVFLGVGGLYFGYYNSIMNVMGSPIAKNLLGKTSQKDADDVIGNLNFLFAFGAAVGALFLGPLSKYVGRIRTLFLCEIVFAGSVILYAQKNEYLLYAARFISGITVALNQALGSIAIVELLPQKIAGAGNVFIYFCITLSILASNLLTTVFSDDSTLADMHIWIMCSPIVITILRLPVLLGFFWKWDTPNYYFDKNLSEDKLTPMIEKVCEPIYSSKDLPKAVKYMVKTEMKRRETEEDVGVLGLFTKRYLPRFLIAIFLNIAQQMSGINFLIYYSKDLFDRINHSGKMISIVIAAANVGGAVIGIYMVGKMGRRFNLQYGSLTQLFAFIAMGLAIQFQQNQALIIVVIVYMVGFAVGLGGVTTLFCSEIVPATAVGIATSIQWLNASLIGKMTPIFLAW